MNQPAHAGLEAVGGLAYVINFLSVVPQQFAFAAGKLPVVMFDMERLLRSLRRLQELIGCSSRRQCRCYSHTRGRSCASTKPAEVQLNQAKSVLAPSWPVDGLDRFPHTLEPEVHHKLQSKEGLARSGLPTPSFEVVEVELPAEVVSAAWLHAETTRIIIQISREATAVRSEATTNHVGLRHLSYPHRV